MADEKLTALAETTDLDDDSLLYVVKDPATVPISRKITFLNMVNEMGLGSYTPQNGWVPVSDTWTPASTTDPYTVTVPAGAEVIYNKGDKVRLKQGGAYKYFYIYGTTDALLDITGGSDYALTTDAITDVYYSKVASPLDFPQWFNYTTAWTSNGNAPAIQNGTLTGRFCIIGKHVTAQIKMAAGGSTTYGTGSYYWSLPTSQATTNEHALGYCLIKDSGTAFHTGVLAYGAATTVLGYYNSANNIGQLAPMTWASGDSIGMEVIYEML